MIWDGTEAIAKYASGSWGHKQEESSNKEVRDLKEECWLLYTVMPSGTLKLSLLSSLEEVINQSSRECSKHTNIHKHSSKHIHKYPHEDLLQALYLKYPYKERHLYGFFLVKKIIVWLN